MGAAVECRVPSRLPEKLGLFINKTDGTRHTQILGLPAHSRSMKGSSSGVKAGLS